MSEQEAASAKALDVKTKKQREADEARVKLRAAKADAKADMDAFERVQSFAMEGECLDKYGEPTRALVIDTDADGVLGLFMEIGQPFSFSHTGDVQEDASKLARYLGHMVNVDMSDNDNLKAIGWDALSQVREVVRGFFTLRLVLGLNVG